MGAGLEASGRRSCVPRSDVALDERAQPVEATMNRRPNRPRVLSARKIIGAPSIRGYERPAADDRVAPHSQVRNAPAAHSCTADALRRQHPTADRPPKVYTADAPEIVPPPSLRVGSRCSQRCRAVTELARPLSRRRAARPAGVPRGEGRAGRVAGACHMRLAAHGGMPRTAAGARDTRMCGISKLSSLVSRPSACVMSVCTLHRQQDDASS
jgi:hypothetical protein